MKILIKTLLILIVSYIFITLIFHRGRLYVRNSYTPISINDSKKNGIFIDSFYFEKLKDFEIWRCYLKYVDYYGLGGLYAHKYIPDKNCYYLALRYKGNKYLNLFFDDKNTKEHSMGYGFDEKYGNGNLWFNKHDSTYIRIFSQPGDTSTVYMVDSINIQW